jgi:transcriptional regulator with XRE-family HTH domain
MCNDLHERLRLARERKGLSLAAIARQCGVREQNLMLIERDAFEELPTGLYGRNAVRSYASAVGIPADEALADVQRRLRDPEDPLDGLARVRGIERGPARKPIETSPPVAPPAAPGFSWRPQAAALIDGAILLAIDLALLELTALTAGLPAADILHLALPSLILLYALIAGVYFVLLGGIRRATIGARIAQAPASIDWLDGVDAHAVMQRGLQCALAEGASLGTWILSTEHAWNWVRTLREKRA